MAISYIPEDTYAVCTMQMNPSPQKFIASRQIASVKTQKVFILTIDDKNLNSAFVCKSPVSLAATFLALGAGLALVVSGPIGWAIAGAALVAGAVYAVKAITHKCTSPLKSGNWALGHTTVNFNRSYAITQNSILNCSSGGILKPFFSYALAKQAASEIAENNIIEVGINTVISFFSGLLAPAAFSKITTFKAAAIFTGTNIAGLGITWTIQYFERDYIRGDEDLKDNTVYQQMNEAEGNGFIQNIDDPSDFNDLDALISMRTMVNDGRVLSHNQELNNRFARLSNLTTDQLKQSPEARVLMNDIAKGEYGAELRNTLQNLFKKVKPNATTVNRGYNHTQTKVNNSFKSMAKTGGQGILFFLPFLATYFSEEARKSLAIYAMEDMTNGTNVVTQRSI